MVAKISSGSSIFGALAYNQTKVDEQKAKVILTNRMIEPRDGNYTIGVSMRSFEPYLAAIQKTESPILHILLCNFRILLIGQYIFRVGIQ